VEISQSGGLLRTLQGGNDLFGGVFVPHEGQKAILLRAVGRDGGSVAHQQKGQVEPTVLQSEENGGLACELVLVWVMRTIIVSENIASQASCMAIRSRLNGH